MSLKDFVNLQKIGEGSYSSVHKVRRISDNQEYALKKVKLSGLSEKEKDNALNEIRILASIAHPNMIAYKDAFFDESSHSLCIVMELAVNGDLSKKIDSAKKRNSFVPEEEIWTVALHMLRGLKAMHSKKILHRDLKCANVFISKQDEYKIGDLNVSKVAKRGLVYTQTGTPYYASPEVWRDEPYDSSSDIWSFGCILYELAALNPPFRAKDMEGLYKKVQKGIFERIPQRYSNDLQKFIALCLQVSSVQRPSVTQLLNNVLLKRNTQFLAESPEEQQDKENTLSPEDLLNTIKMPKNPRQLKEKLPKPQYDKEILNNSYDGEIQRKERNHNRNMSVKMNRIQSVTNHKQHQYLQQQQQLMLEQEGKDVVLPLIPRSQQQKILEPISNSQLQAQQNNSNIIGSQNDIYSRIGSNRYENSSSIVSDSRNYLQEIQPKKRINQNGSSGNYNEDYSQKYNRYDQQPRSINSPTISVISKKDTGYSNPVNSINPLRNRVNSINQINSYARIANLYQNSKNPYNNYSGNSMQSVSIDYNPQYSRPVWWG
ncbi:plant dual-specificity MAP kinase kinase family domain protein (macronuclear) [Tetrahymena thermophila SB210]|uniref:non-specific serine/threonine protein kinase n=1 Tax=Tetrahymena thermophila (strain SB210) TaxID=312017 RepID=Q245S5_TETTS|nr:plant dual-specificity MAP kinase kinase family domain protein [Tetrahymena thermophila SB210]EAS03558.1 plant dual-specificity MAP kinase kinase family domain protein [Tetrahymena thermophila SB210]|eukprot:XP_001023803.1 plant dual-specificity MAP kinase kinase family domain protein [Tetrahymena thermophila SB210]